MEQNWKLQDLLRSLPEFKALKKRQKAEMKTLCDRFVHEIQLLQQRHRTAEMTFFNSAARLIETHPPIQDSHNRPESAHTQLRQP
jgi:hypothetical protein